MEYDPNTVRQEAIRKHRAGDYGAAGTAYTCAAHGELGATWESEMDNRVGVSIALYCLLASVVCYRLEGYESRSRNRAREGQLIATDLRQNVFSEDPLQGLLYEYHGDFQVLLEDDDYEESYALAKQEYGQHESPPAWIYEDEFDWSREFFSQLATAADHTIDRPRYFHSFPQQRIEYKLSKFQGIIRKTYGTGEWRLGASDEDDQ